jgi:hypothetical protein
LLTACRKKIDGKWRVMVVSWFLVSMARRWPEDEFKSWRRYSAMAKSFFFLCKLSEKCVQTIHSIKLMVCGFSGTDPTEQGEGSAVGSPVVVQVVQ